MEKQIRVSIILPIYNAENHIKKTLDSILAQTFANIEIICVNDGSKDRTIEILRDFRKQDERIKIIDKKMKEHGKLD